MGTLKCECLRIMLKASELKDDLQNNSNEVNKAQIYL